MKNLKKFLAGIACTLVIVAASVAPAFAATASGDWASLRTTKRNNSTAGNTYTIQRAMTLDSVRTNSIDGSFGSDTEKKVKLYQGKLGLTADGIVGPNTWRMLGRKVTGPTLQMYTGDNPYTMLAWQKISARSWKVRSRSGSMIGMSF